MKKYNRLFISTLLALGSSSIFASNNVSLYNEPLSSLKGFNIQSEHSSANFLADNQMNELVPIGQSKLNGKTYQRLQQTYNGIEVVGKQLVIESDSNGNLNENDATVSGAVIQNLEINTVPEVSANFAFDQAVSLFQKAFPSYQIINNSQKPIVKRLQILPQGNQNKLAYFVKFNAASQGKVPVEINARIDAKTGKVISILNNIQNYEDTGPGGNEKVGQYWYGENNMPALDVTKGSGNSCVMKNTRVKAVNLNGSENDITTAYQYVCGQNQGDAINGSYSALNDAFYFGDIIIDMYNNWYHTNALHNSDGSKMQLIMRVHYGANYENAFWNGENMTFGDGDPNGMFYPLVSLDVAGHEVSHGFTQQHSNLEYKDQSGSLNEAFSDMAGQSVRAYLLSQSTHNYQAFYPQDPNGAIGWGLGETITRGEGQSLRYMNQPSNDGRSADCYDQSLASKSGAICKITYDDVVDAANSKYPWWQWNKRQGYIVHTGSGVFNKAFYLLSNKWIKQMKNQGDANANVDGIKKAFEVMVYANNKYWSSQSNFQSAACGVKHAAKDLGYSVNDITNIFNQVGVSTKSCAV